MSGRARTSPHKVIPEPPNTQNSKPTAAKDISPHKPKLTSPKHQSTPKALHQEWQQKGRVAEQDAARVEGPQEKLYPPS